MHTQESEQDFAAAQRLARIHTLLSRTTSSPWAHDMLELAMAVVVSPTMGEGLPVWLMLVADPSGGKTETVLTFTGLSDRVYFLDAATENFAASGYKHPQTGEIAEDPVSNWDGKCVVIKEMASIFSMHPKRVQSLLGVLQALYDGSYVKVTGTVGRRESVAHLAMLACVTPAALEDHRAYMARIGPRFLTYRAPALTEEQEKAGHRLLKASGGTRNARASALGRPVREHVTALTAGPDDHSRALIRPSDDARIIQFSALIAAGRSLMYPADGERRVQKEQPFRAVQQLRTLAQALALVHGRRRVTAHELELLRRVALSSIPVGRFETLMVLADHPDGMSAKASAAVLQKSDDAAADRLKDLVKLDLLTEETGPPQRGRPPGVYHVAPRFAPLLSPILPLDHEEGPAATDRVPGLPTGGTIRWVVDLPEDWTLPSEETRDDWARWVTGVSDDAVIKADRPPKGADEPPVDGDARPTASGERAEPLVPPLTSPLASVSGDGASRFALPDHRQPDGQPDDGDAPQGDAVSQPGQPDQARLVEELMGSMGAGGADFDS